MLSNEYVFNEQVSLNVLMSKFKISILLQSSFICTEDSWTFSSIHRITSKNECVADDPKEKE